MVVDTLIQMHTHRATGSLLNSAPTTFGKACQATGIATESTINKFQQNRQHSVLQSGIPGEGACRLACRANTLGGYLMLEQKRMCRLISPTSHAKSLAIIRIGNQQAVEKRAALSAATWYTKCEGSVIHSAPCEFKLCVVFVPLWSARRLVFSE